MSSDLSRAASSLLALAAIALPSVAHAGGFYLADRGTRSLGRGGAYVAGVEDPHALWYNPAGLAYSGDQLLLDVTETLMTVDYTRIDSGGQTLPTVHGYHPYVPIPTIAGSFSLEELPNFTFGIGLLAPNASLMQWPEEVVVGGVPEAAPQRYSLLSLEGSLLAMIGAGVAWRPIEELTIGFDTHLMFGNFDARVAMSACDGVICSFPEDPEYDGIAQISLPVAYPIFQLGAIVDLDFVRIGASVMTPYNLEGNASIAVRPPSAGAFQGARVVSRRAGCNWSDPSAECRDDTRADVQIEFPWVARFGVEVRPLPELRLEAAVVWETWSVQDEVRVRPNAVYIEDALGGAFDYEVGPLSVPRRMKDTVSLRLGGSYTIDRLVTVSLGGYYENGAFDDAYLSVLTIDSDKFLVSAGVSVDVSDEVSLDAMGGYLWMASRSIRNSEVPLSNPIRPALDQPLYVANGDYSMGAPFFGLGVRWRVDAGRIAGPGEQPVVEPPPVAPVAPEVTPTAPEPSVDPSRPWYLQNGEAAPSAAPAPIDPEAGDVIEPPVPDEPEPERPRRRRRARRR